MYAVNLRTVSSRLSLLNVVFVFGQPPKLSKSRLVACAALKNKCLVKVGSDKQDSIINLDDFLAGLNLVPCSII